jgi:hypothetical protein
LFLLVTVVINKGNKENPAFRNKRVIELQEILKKKEKQRKEKEEQVQECMRRNAELEVIIYNFFYFYFI